ncbi:MAG: hypothetical protein H6604_02560 [Flavobacteriales bacterium]|nr:hypothetical protein [Flavobacteriales bacterium]
MKNILLLVLLGSVFFSCEDDDICTESYTSRLFIKSYEYRTGNDLTIDSFVTKTIDTLYIERINSDNTSDYFISTNSNTLLIPIDETSESPTRFNFYLSEDASEDEKTKIILNYTKTENYVSKACGFRYEFSDISYEVTNQGFIDSIAQNLNSITNESSPHFSFFH